MKCPACLFSCTMNHMHSLLCRYMSNQSCHFLCTTFLIWYYNYIILFPFCQYPFTKDLDVLRLNNSVYATEKRSCLLRRRHRLLARVLQGLPASPQSSVIRTPTATPHLLSSSAVARLVKGSVVCRYA